MATTPPSFPNPNASPEALAQQVAQAQVPLNVQIAQRNQYQLQRMTQNAQGLLNALETDISKLPEHIFVGFFLPYFCGETSTSDGRNAIAQWISVAGSPGSEVSIVDGEGKELFRVPSLMDTEIFNAAARDPKNPRQVGFSAIVDLAMQYGRQLPARGTNFLAENLAKKRAEISTQSKVHTSNEKRWLEIFKRYNKIQSGTLAKKVQAEGQLSDDDFE